MDDVILPLLFYDSLVFVREARVHAWSMLVHAGSCRLMNGRRSLRFFDSVTEHTHDRCVKRVLEDRVFVSAINVGVCHSLR